MHVCMHGHVRNTIPGLKTLPEEESDSGRAASSLRRCRASFLPLLRPRLIAHQTCRRRLSVEGWHELYLPPLSQPASHHHNNNHTHPQLSRNGHPTSLQRALPHHPGQDSSRADVCLPNPLPTSFPTSTREHEKRPCLADILPSDSTSQNPDDVVITLAIRTPLTKAGKGGFKDTPLDGLVFKILEQVVRKSNLDPQLVEDICLGNVCCIP